MTDNLINRVNLILLASGFALFIAMFFVVFYSLFFLSGNLLHAFSAEAEVVVPIQFDIEGFNKLNL
ncbi:MAG: hypothetical protein HYS87_00610 [Candidatus Colwellbacteria bacterium]|nr:hypothetical protein [Candidatus Colwellbacteria bacterium]